MWKSEEYWSKTGPLRVQDIAPVEEDQDPVEHLTADEITKQRLKAFMTHIDARHRRS